PLHREAQVGAQRRSDEDPAQEPLADSGRGAAWHVASVTGATVVPVTVSPQPSAPAGHGTLALTVQGGALTSGFFTPRVHVDGYPVPVAFGTTPIPLVPGRHRVDV